MQYLYFLKQEILLFIVTVKMEFFGRAVKNFDLGWS